MMRNSIFPDSINNEKNSRYLANQYYFNCKMAFHLYEVNKVAAEEGRYLPRLPKDDPRRRVAQTYQPGTGWRVNRWLSNEFISFKKLFS